ncbi:membrane protein [Ruminiclostridium cellulolyticum]|uniref:Membrane protein YkvI n=1 Tax=Ruminiclostridium cellulolyticum (strain ATCC 35319 / DSM 5812 / JCM 6584 / H10) TaxID=394503 RepID=B8I5A6_RUMCH|nr:membrane protein [Ruminiclostridium cellulolyticum]ACL74686.1 conserved hypothetical protein [Ruminiclostridium cellulolyticum H10]
MIKGEFSNILKVAFLYMATIIGAGFASGQEIIQFFSIYYKGGFLGIILAGGLFSIVGYIVLSKVYTERIKSYDEFLFPMMGYFFGKIMEFVVMLFMACVMSVMTAGLGNILMGLTGLQYRYCVIIGITVCLLAILTNIKGIVVLSSFISPVLIAGIIFVGCYILVSKDTSVFNISNKLGVITNNWAFSSILYVSYNTILSTVLLTGMLPYLKSKKVSAWGGLLGGGMLGATALILNSALYFFYPHSITSEIPVLGIIQNNSQMLSKIYSGVLILAMFISTVTSGYCLAERISKKMKVNYKLVAIIICAIAVPLTSLGFSNLISTLYPVFGYLGLFLLFVIIFQYIRGIISSRYSRG